MLLALSYKMNKIRTILNRWQSFLRVGRSHSNLTSVSDPFHADAHDWDRVIAPTFAENRPSRLVHADNHKLDEVPEECKIVYVGKSRKRYFLSAHYASHPLLRVLIVESFRDGFSVACEVVLFEHLVWMLENTEPEAIQSDSSMKELAEFYAFKL